MIIITPRAGELSGQFIVVPLVDFDGKALHASEPKSSFKLRLNRTEVVRRKANHVVPISPLEARYNKSNYSLDGAYGPAVDVVHSEEHGDLTDREYGALVSEDVVYDPLIYDYVLPSSKEVDALTVSAAPGRGGIDIARTHPAKYRWDQMPEFHSFMKDSFPESICRKSADPSASNPVDEGVAIPASGPDINDDLAAAFPILPDAIPAGI